MKIKMVVTVTLVTAALQLSCADFDVTRSQAEADALQKIRSGQYELIKTDELTQLRRDAEIGKSVGRFQMRQIGFRTWRLDTATGFSCLLLTSEADWKKPETAMQGCSQ
jgi:hypothetical protein